MFSIGDMAAQLGITPRAIRLYEDQGLLSPRRVGGNRIYSPRDFARLKLILRGKRLGFRLSEIGEMLDLYDVDPDHLEQLRVTLDKGRKRIGELERQQHEITVTLRELRQLETVIVETIEQRESGSAQIPSQTSHPKTREELPLS